jgi:hypothetical protein
MRFITVYTASVRVFQTRTVCCANCGEQYLYDMKAKGQAKASTGEGFIRALSGSEAKEKASAEARASAEQQLADTIDVVPCPTCGNYQPDMVALLKKRRHPWLFTLGSLALIGALALSGLGALAKTHQEELLTWGGLSALAAAALLLLRWFLVRRFNPNAGDPEKRKLLAQERAYRPEDAAQIQHDRDNQIDADKRQREAEEILKGMTGWAFFGLIAVLAGTAMGVVGGRHIANGLDSPNWPTTKGQIARSDHVEVSRDRKTQKATTHVSYSYTVNQRKYVSRDIWSGPVTDNDKALQQYTSGMEVTVHYHPTNPAVAVLQPGLKVPHSYGMALVGGVSFLIGLICLAVAWSRYCGYDQRMRSAEISGRKIWRPAVALRPTLPSLPLPGQRR